MPISDRIFLGIVGYGVWTALSIVLRINAPELSNPTCNSAGYALFKFVASCWIG